MPTTEGQEYFLPVIVRPWFSAGHGPSPYRPFKEIRIADLFGVAASIGFIPVYQTADALRREHPVANELFFSKDTRLFPTLCRRWICEYRPASSIGYVPVYATLKGLREDFPDSPYTKARLDMEDFRLPLAGSFGKEDFAGSGPAGALRSQKEGTGSLISIPNTEQALEG